ncbi:MAG TPA: histidinol-phosphate transaminase [Bryobacteraceae bacterium]|nr:histidinol-phosphate transaminase [Bryobacteraceae bacterium]
MPGSDILVPAHILSLNPYEAGLTPNDIRDRFQLNRIVKLSSNENPLGVSPLAIESARQELAAMSRYPDGGLALRRKLADRFNMKVENVIAGSGSEGIMADILRTFLCDDDEVLTTEAAFLGFQVLAHGRGVSYRTVPYRDWHYDLDALAMVITERTKLIYLANPNNPTGTTFTRQAFEEFHARVPRRVLIILDEAYFEFAIDDPAFPDSLRYRFDNVITLRTFSKVYGLAAARVGYGFAHQDLIAMLLKIKLPFAPSGPSAAAAFGALDDKDFLHKSIESNRLGREFLTQCFREAGFTVAPSSANFVMAVFESPEQARLIFEELLKRGVIVRPLRATGIPNALRISVGTPEENQMCVDALNEICAQIEVHPYATTV